MTLSDSYLCIGLMIIISISLRVFCQKKAFL